MWRWIISWKSGPGTPETLLQNCPNVGIGSVYSQEHSYTRNRVSKDWNGGKEEFNS